MNREEKNNKFLERNKINKRLSIVCNSTIYTKETVMDAIYLPHWMQLSEEGRAQCIVWIFDNLVKELNLEKYVEKVLFIPKAGYEDAFASYDKEDKGIFINPKYIESTSLLCIWNIFHEFQHVIQHKDEDLIKKGILMTNDFYNSFAYYFMYDGTSYRFSVSEEFVYKIKGTEDFCLELYLRNPMEIDANHKAYLKLRKVIESNLSRFGNDDETVKDLQEIKDMLLPEFNIITNDVAMDIVKYCQALVELAYQFSKDNIDESDYNKKDAELYNAISQLTKNKGHVQLSFNLEELLS